MLNARQVAKRIALLTVAATAFAATPCAAVSPVDVSILTYNVHAPPWPAATGRAGALRAIAARLRTLRAQGRQPHVVAIQEAFTADGKAIGAAAGYRYVSFGPDATMPVSPSTVADRTFLDSAGYMHFERTGKWTDSGLAIFSDYPIVASRRIAYPICAGYDCLANKGALAVRLRIPGVAVPVIVVDTHLNANRASGVSSGRAFRAYRRQLDILAGFVASVTTGRSALFLAGDFNVGHNPDRRAYFGYRMHAPGLALASAVASCDPPLGGCLTSNRAGLAESARRAKDWMMFRSSPSVTVATLGLAAPFGRGPNGTMLSDHVGISATYRLATIPRPPSLSARSALRL